MSANGRTAVRRALGPLLLAIASTVALATVPGSAQSGQMNARLPFGAAPGDKVTLTVNVGDTCEPGTAEVGFSTRKLDEFHLGDKDPRDGSEIVLARPTKAPGSKADVEITMPDPGVTEPVFYAICRFEDVFKDSTWIGMVGSYRFGDGGAGRPSTSPSPSPGNHPPVAASDTYQAAAKEALSIPTPGVLSNDTDPDGDPIVAVIKARSSTTVASARFRPNGALEAKADAAGILCIEYLARDSKGAVSKPATVVISIGGADASKATDGSACRLQTDKGPFEFKLDKGEGELTDEMIESPSTSSTGASAIRGMFPAPRGALLAYIPVPHGADCWIWNCLYGFFHPPYFSCNQNVFTLSFGRSRYGSMTAYGYIRKGNADYAKVRGLFYEDGRLIKTTGWETKYFIGTGYTAWNSVYLYQQFGSPNSIYRVGFQAHWYQDISWGRDRQIAATAGNAPVPYECMAGP